MGVARGWPVTLGRLLLTLVLREWANCLDRPLLIFFSAGTLLLWWAHCTWSGWYSLSCGSCREGSLPSSWLRGASLESISRNTDHGQVGWFPCVHSVASLCPSIVSLTPVCTFYCWSDSRVSIPLLPFQL